jgi:hypothetical protein
MPRFSAFFHVLSLWIALGLLPNAGLARLWTAVDGRTVEAKLEHADAATVTILRYEDDRSFTLERALLAECDQAYIEGWLEGRSLATAPRGPALVFSADPFQAPDRTNRAAVLRHYREQLQPLEFNWRQVGSVLEALGYLELQRLYPAPAFTVFHSLQYHDASGRTLGEIDLLVWDNATEQVIAVYECKISAQPRRVLEHAKEQLDRFRAALRDRTVARFTLTGARARNFSVTDFRALEHFETIGGAGTRSQGYDLEIDLSRDEADELQAMLLQSTAR